MLRLQQVAREAQRRALEQERQRVKALPANWGAVVGSWELVKAPLGNWAQVKAAPAS